MPFELLTRIRDVESIAIGSGIRDLERLRSRFGPGVWRKKKGVARVRLRNGHVRLAEQHWSEAHGIGRVLVKIKRFLD